MENQLLRPREAAAMLGLSEWAKIRQTSPLRERLPDFKSSAEASVTCGARLESGGPGGFPSVYIRYWTGPSMRPGDAYEKLLAGPHWSGGIIDSRTQRPPYRSILSEHVNHTGRFWVSKRRTAESSGFPRKRCSGAFGSYNALAIRSARRAWE